MKASNVVFLILAVLLLALTAYADNNSKNTTKPAPKPVPAKPIPPARPLPRPAEPPKKGQIHDPINHGIPVGDVNKPGPNPLAGKKPGDKVVINGRTYTVGANRKLSPDGIYVPPPK